VKKTVVLLILAVLLALGSCTIPIPDAGPASVGTRPAAAVAA
jgi:hypothetical protein